MKKCLSFTFIIAILINGSCVKEKNNPTNDTGEFNPTIEIGTEIIDITPQDYNGVLLAGYHDRYANGVHDPITARFLVMDDGKNEIVFITFDFAGLDYPALAELLPAIATETDIPIDNIFTHATHTHSAQSLYYYTDMERQNELVAKIIQGIKSAKTKKVMCQVKIANGVSGVKTINRRNPSVQVSNSIVIAQFQDASFNTIATLLNFACHPVVLGPDNLQISSDYVHYVREKIEKDIGGASLFFSGSLGDINPESINKGVYDRSGGTFEMASKLGYQIANDAIKLLKEAETQKLSIQTISKEITINERLTKVSLIDLEALQILTIPGEPLSGFQPEIEPILDAEFKMFFGLTHDRIGYIVSKDEWGLCTKKPYCYEETDSPGDSTSSLLINEYHILVNELKNKK